MSSPCSNCKNKDLCSENFLACEDYKFHYKSGEIITDNREPKAEIYDEIFSENDRRSSMKSLHKDLKKVCKRRSDADKIVQETFRVNHKYLFEVLYGSQ